MKISPNVKPDKHAYSMDAYRPINNLITLKHISTSNIFKELGWHSYPKIIMADAIKIIYKINNLSMPRALINFFTFNNSSHDNINLVRTPSLKFKPYIARTQKLQLFRGTYYFGSLPYELRVSDRFFKDKLKCYISSKTSVYCMNKPMT